MAVFGLHNDQKEIHVKSKWQKNHDISTLCIPSQAAQVCMDSFSKSNKIRNVKIDFLVQVPNRRKKFEKKNCHVNKELYDFR